MLFIFPFGKELAPTIFSWFLVPESNDTPKVTSPKGCRYYGSFMVARFFVFF